MCVPCSPTVHFLVPNKASATRRYENWILPSTIAFLSSEAFILRIGLVLWAACAKMSWTCHGRNNGDMVQTLQKNNILTSAAAAQAMKQIDRAEFVLSRNSSYDDSPQSIGYGATISAPHMHAYCLSLLSDHLKHGSAVLDVGSGSGYLTAVFALMVGETGKAVGVEHIPELVQRSIEAIKKGEAAHLLESGQLSIHTSDGKLGYPDGAPYDAIHVGAAAAVVPDALIAQLKPGGRMVIPVGQSVQDLMVIDKQLDGSLKQRSQMGVRYVPLI